jgi:glycine oxidase
MFCAFGWLTAGLRPAVRDNAPVIGSSSVDGLYYATGHYRSGILYTPITAFGIVHELLENKVFDELQDYRPTRFSD